MLVCLALAAGRAQEGHPLTGTWSGDWGPAASERHHLTVVMTWDGQQVTGTINPGPDAIPIGSVRVDYSAWVVQIDADAKDRQTPIRVDARFENLGSPHRRLAGTWREGTTSGGFTIVRE